MANRWSVTSLRWCIPMTRVKRTRRRHVYVPTRGAHERCARCDASLDDVQHKAVLCACWWRVADKRCVCRRDRDRFGDDRCIWCREGYHLIEDSTITHCLILIAGEDPPDRAKMVSLVCPSGPYSKI
jgi:hypothetical protein